LAEWCLGVTGLSLGVAGTSLGVTESMLGAARSNLGVAGTGLGASGLQVRAAGRAPVAPKNWACQAKSRSRIMRGTMTQDQSPKSIGSTCAFTLRI